MTLASGSRLGPYEVSALIGEGGMGEVYRATDTNLGRQVAIKILPDTFAHDPEHPARFEMVQETASTSPAGQLNVVVNWFEELKRRVPTN